jgi:hypothetical protein
MIPHERISPSARNLRNASARMPDTPFFQGEFGFCCLERSKELGMA